MKGFKIGLTSKAMQEMLGIHTPDYGFTLDAVVYDENTPIDPSAYIQPKVEFELAFYFKKTLQRRLKKWSLMCNNTYQAIP